LKAKRDRKKNYRRNSLPSSRPRVRFAVGKDLTIRHLGLTRGQEVRGSREGIFVFVAQKKKMEASGWGQGRV